MTSQKDRLLWWAEQEVASGDLALARAHLSLAAAYDLSAGEAERVAQLLAQTVPVESELTDRHRAQAGWLGSLGAEVLAACPRCGKPGTVVAGPAHPGGRFTCSGCAYRAEDVWLGPGRLTGDARCHQCGRWITVDQPSRGGHPHQTTVAAHCPACTASNKVTVRLSHTAGLEHDPPLEPVMGLALWLAVQTRHGWLWALNAEHLDELRHLVAARVRDTPSGNSHWVNRLPPWIVAAKNRQEIGRALDHLHATLP